jgi:hypothetical protein
MRLDAGDCPPSFGAALLGVDEGAKRRTCP